MPRIMRRAHLILFVLLLGVVGIDAHAREVKLHSYEARLDEAARAQVRGWGYTVVIRGSDFHDLRTTYQPAVYDEWARRLKTVKPGQSAEEVEAILHPRSTDHTTRVKSRTITTYVLDDAYFLWAIYSPDRKLKAISRHPQAITYDVIPDEDVPKR